MDPNLEKMVEQTNLMIKGIILAASTGLLVIGGVYANNKLSSKQEYNASEEGF